MQLVTEGNQNSAMLLFARWHSIERYTKFLKKNGVTIAKSNRATLIADIRRPEGPPSGAPYPYKKEKKSHELVFSCLPWLAALRVGAYARRRRPRQSRAAWLP